MTPADKKVIIDEIQSEYVLIRKGKLWQSLGGALMMLVVTGVVTYKAALSAVSLSSEEAKKDELSLLLSNSRLISKEIIDIRDRYKSEYEMIGNYFNLAEKNEASVTMNKVAIERLGENIKRDYVGWDSQIRLFNKDHKNCLEGLKRDGSQIKGHTCGEPKVDWQTWIIQR